jgi:hypothetical protein
MKSGLFLMFALPFFLCADNLPPGITSTTTGTTDGVGWTANWLPFPSGTNGDYFISLDMPASYFEVQITYPDGSRSNEASETPPSIEGTAEFSFDHRTETISLAYTDARTGFGLSLAYNSAPAYVPPITFLTIKDTNTPEPWTVVLAAAGLIIMLTRRMAHSGPA